MNSTSTQTVNKEQYYCMKRNAKKPRCPFCNNLLTNIFGDTHGLFSVKCLRCKHEVLIDADNMVVYTIEEETC